MIVQKIISDALTELNGPQENKNFSDDVQTDDLYQSLFNLLASDYNKKNLRATESEDQQELSHSLTQASQDEPEETVLLDSLMASGMAKDPDEAEKLLEQMKIAVEMIQASLTPTDSGQDGLKDLNEASAKGHLEQIEFETPLANLNLSEADVPASDWLKTEEKLTSPDMAWNETRSLTAMNLAFNAKEIDENDKVLEEGELRMRPADLYAVRATDESFVDIQRDRLVKRYQNESAAIKPSEYYDDSDFDGFETVKAPVQEKMPEDLNRAFEKRIEPSGVSKHPIDPDLKTIFKNSEVNAIEHEPFENRPDTTELKSAQKLTEQITQQLNQSPVKLQSQDGADQSLSMPKEKPAFYLSEFVPKEKTSPEHFSFTEFSAKIKVHPKDLGAITAQIQIHDGKTTIVMSADHQHVKAFLDAHLNQLRTNFQEADLQLEQVDIEHHPTDTADDSDKRYRERSMQGDQEVLDDETRVDVEQKKISTSLVDTYA